MNPAGRTAAVIVLAQSLGLALLAIWQLMAMVAGDTAALDSAIALLVLTLAGVAILATFGVATWRDASWGRSGSIVAQVLILAVALGAATGAYAHPLTALAIAAPSAVTLILLFAAARRAGQNAKTGSDAE
ncbi:histidine kinase [Microbacterium sediminicola]